MFIELTKGLKAIIDKEDYEKTLPYSWHTHMAGGRKNPSPYASAYIRGSYKATGKNKSVRLHNLIMPPPDGLFIDHINGNTLDNRKSNLRFVTRSENQHNKKKFQKKTSSKYKGVYWVKCKQRWKARIHFKGKTLHIKEFRLPYEKEAALAYDKKAKELFGEYARLNFPMGGS